MPRKKSKKQQSQPQYSSSDDEEVEVKSNVGSDASEVLEPAKTSSPFDALADSSSAGESSGEESDVPAAPATSGFAALSLGSDAESESSAQPSESEPEPESEPEQEEEPEPSPESEPESQETDNKSSKNDIDDILEFLDAPAPKKNKKKKKKVAKVAENIDSILAELESSEPLSKPEEKKPEVKEEENLAEDNQPLSKAQLKRLRKKKNKETSSSEKPVSEAPAKTNKISALAQRLERERLEREKFEREEAERTKKFEEEERLRIAEIKRIAEEKAKKAEEKRLRKEELKRQGKLLTKTQRAKAKKAQEMLAHLESQGIIVGDSEDTSSREKKNKPVKKRKGGKKDKFARLRADAEDTENTPETESIPEVVPEVVPENLEPEVVEEEEILSEIEDEDWEALEAEVEAWNSSDEDGEDESDEDVVEAWDMDSDEEEQAREERRLVKEEKKRVREEEKQRKLEEIRERKAKVMEKRRLRAEKVANKRTELENKNAKSSSKESAHTSAIVSETSEEISAKSGEKSKSPVDMKNLRSPICCILGHVDTGKTKILDKIRNTSVQDKEAGGITQQIGASYFPMEVIKKQTTELLELSKGQIEYHLPGLLIIDTPGHESFTNLRSRGSSLCDIAILVVDLMHGLEPQTVESINLLKARKTPFIVALNKIDRIYGWNPQPWGSFRKTLKDQKDNCKREFEQRVQSTIAQFQAEGLNCALYYKNKDINKNISLVPTSAHTGEGLPDLLMLLVQLTQKKMSKRLQYLSGLECTVLEVKRVEGKGTTLDVVLSNGSLKKGDTIVVCGLNGPIVTTIRALLTPAPLSDIRVKGEYLQLDEVKAAAGIKIAAAGLDDAIAGSALLVLGKNDDVEMLKDEVMQDLASVLSRVDKTGLGVSVQASSIGSMEALLQFLSDMKIPVSAIAIGPVHRKDIMRAGIMNERGKNEFACILAFDVNVAKDMKALADKRNVRIFSADIIYHLFDQFTAYMDKIKKDRLEEAKEQVVFPCILEIIPEFVFRTKDPILIGCRVVSGILKLGTPLCAPDKQNLAIGKVVSIEKNTVNVQEARPGEEVALRIEMSNQPTLGRHFDVKDRLVSVITRQTIDLLKANFKDYLSQDDWKLVVKLKKVFDIM